LKLGASALTFGHWPETGKDTTATAPDKFMKPARVDKPREIQSPSLSTSEKSLDYAWQKSSKRQREPIVTGSEMSTKAKKKRKKNCDS
jgi:5'-3' exonuclease